MIKIYKLIHNGQIVYVGQTRLELMKRKAHGYGDTVPFYKECSIELIEETDDISRERYWIERLRSEGHPLLNIQKGESGLIKKEYHRRYNDKHYQKNKEKISEYKKRYYQINKGSKKTQ